MIEQSNTFISSLTASDVVTIAVGLVLVFAGLVMGIRSMRGGLPPESIFWIRSSGLLLVVGGTIVLALEVVAVMRAMASAG